jgi:phenylacetate-CoA ligase
MNLYGKLFQSVLFPAWESGVKKRPTLNRRNFLEKTQWRSLDELHAIQAGALRRLIRHAYANVPLYREKLQAVGLTDANIRTPEDLRKMPLLSRNEARARPKDRESTAAPFTAIRKNTGGTTGQPLLFGYDLDSEYWRNAAKLRGYGWAGYQLGDKALHFWGAPVERRPPFQKRAKIAVDRWLRREHYISCGVMSDEVLALAARTIATERPTALVCYTQAGAELARFITKNGLRKWESVNVICGAERLFPHDRAALEAAFGPGVYETYGCREVMLIGGECEAHDGLHLTMENLIVEVLVTEADGTSRPAKEGERGDVVITDLHNLGMPFIRYANGDSAIAGPTTRCSCGRTLPRLAYVEGRTTDTLRDAEGSAISGLVFNVVFTALASAVRQFQVVQHKDRSVTLRVVPGEAFNEAVLEETRRECGRFLKGVDVRIEKVAEIPLTAGGKHRVSIVET